ncbi:hypothetical protein [Paenibacillus sp. PAMC21692]|nr:hypothetical protein [Paenibacillus sp. PAMC21692]QNK60297.1 hypothetical protein H7F31_16360 [Paenibacillus sp. PAMC21692]
MVVLEWGADAGVGAVVVVAVADANAGSGAGVRRFLQTVQQLGENTQLR